MSLIFQEHVCAKPEKNVLESYRSVIYLLDGKCLKNELRETVMGETGKGMEGVEV